MDGKREKRRRTESRGERKFVALKLSPTGSRCLGTRSLGAEPQLSDCISLYLNCCKPGTSLRGSLLLNY